MTVVCLTAPIFRRLALAALMCWVPFGLTSCSSTPEPVAAGSSLPRGDALAFAQQTARSVGGSVFTVAPTGSMKPTLDENSVVSVEAVTFTALRRGDIVVYRNKAGVPVIHRLNTATAGGWVVLGDNNADPDIEPVTPANLLGRVCAIFYTTAGPDLPARSAALAQSPGHR